MNFLEQHTRTKKKLFPLSLCFFICAKVPVRRGQREREKRKYCVRLTGALTGYACLASYLFAAAASRPLRPQALPDVSCCRPSAPQSQRFNQDAAEMYITQSDLISCCDAWEGWVGSLVLCVPYVSEEKFALSEPSKQLLIPSISLVNNLIAASSAALSRAERSARISLDCTG